MQLVPSFVTFQVAVELCGSNCDVLMMGMLGTGLGGSSYPSQGHHTNQSNPPFSTRDQILTRKWQKLMFILFQYVG